MKCMYYLSFSAIFVFTNCRGSPWGGEPGDSKLVLAAVEFGLLSQDGEIHGIAWLRRSPVVVPWGGARGGTKCPGEGCSWWNTSLLAMRR